MFGHDDLGPSVPRLPPRKWTTIALQLVAAAVLHMIGAAAIVAVVQRPATVVVTLRTDQTIVPPVETRHIVFIARGPFPAGGGGGGGGNRQSGPIRHAQGIGSDALTLRVATPTSTSGRKSVV